MTTLYNMTNSYVALLLERNSILIDEEQVCLYVWINISLIKNCYWKPQKKSSEEVFAKKSRMVFTTLLFISTYTFLYYATSIVFIFFLFPCGWFDRSSTCHGNYCIGDSYTERGIETAHHYCHNTLHPLGGQRF